MEQSIKDIDSKSEAMHNFEAPDPIAEHSQSPLFNTATVEYMGIAFAIACIVILATLVPLSKRFSQFIRKYVGQKTFVHEECSNESDLMVDDNSDSQASDGWMENYYHLHDCKQQASPYEQVRDFHNRCVSTVENFMAAVKKGYCLKPCMTTQPCHACKQLENATKHITLQTFLSGMMEHLFRAVYTKAPSASLEQALRIAESKETYIKSLRRKNQYRTRTTRGRGVTSNSFRGNTFSRGRGSRRSGNTPDYTGFLPDNNFDGIHSRRCGITGQHFPQTHETMETWRLRQRPEENMQVAADDIHSEHQD